MQLPVVVKGGKGEGEAYIINHVFQPLIRRNRNQKTWGKSEGHAAIMAQRPVRKQIIQR